MHNCCDALPRRVRKCVLRGRWISAQTFKCVCIVRGDKSSYFEEIFRKFHVDMSRGELSS